MEASGTPPADQTPAHVSFLDKLRGFALQVEHRVVPSEIADILSAVVALVDHAGLEIPPPPPPPAADEPTPAGTADQAARIQELEAQLAAARSQQPADTSPPAVEP